MKPRILASVCAVLLCLYCEFYQASPFALLEGRGKAGARMPVNETVTGAECDLTGDMGTLFGPAKITRSDR